MLLMHASRSEDADADTDTNAIANLARLSFSPVLPSSPFPSSQCQCQCQCQPAPVSKSLVPARTKGVPSTSYPGIKQIHKEAIADSRRTVLLILACNANPHLS